MDLNDLSETQKEILIIATEDKVNTWLEQVKEAQDLLHYLKHGEKISETRSRKFKWTKLVTESLSAISEMVDSKPIYDWIFELHEKDFLDAEMDRRTVISRLSGALSQLKRKQILCFENQLGEQIYGLAEWFESDKETIKDDIYLSNYANSFRKFGIKLISDDSINDTEFETVGKYGDDDEIEMPF